MRTEIYTAYAANNDMTFIMKDIFDGDDIKSTEVIGWYYGNPDDENTRWFAGKLKDEYLFD